MGPVLATEGELSQTASCTASRQCVEANGARAVVSNDGKQTNKSAEGWGSNTLPYCLAIWVLKISRNWYKSLRRTQKAD
jgi:hypothetical protein